MAKLPAGRLNDLLSSAFQGAIGTNGQKHPMSPPGDCAVLPMEAGGVLLATVDYAPLVGRDPEVAGRIAALHAISDVLATGGIPRWALVHLILDMGELPEVHEALLIGIIKACVNEGVTIVGGHTTVGPEMTAGLTVLGYPRDEQPLAKFGAKPGDELWLSKPLGVGIALRAVAARLAPSSVYDEAVSLMLQSNARASIAAVRARVHASTDVSGFGLLGHLSEMLNGQIGANLILSHIPCLNGIGGMDDLDWLSNSECLNFDYASEQKRLVGITDRRALALLLDPQTNGGLLVAVPSDQTPPLAECGYSPIGRVTDTNTIEIE